MLCLASLTACGSDEPDFEESSVEVGAVSDTTVEAGAVQVRLPGGGASGGKLAVQEGPEPTMVPEGIKAIGPSAVVSLFDGTLNGPMTVSFAPPADLTADLVPIIMAKDEQGEWQWLPTSWDVETERIAAELPAPGQVYLARLDRAPLLESVVEELTLKATNLAKVKPPTCGDEATPVDSGLQITGEPGDRVLWCAGVDTIESNPAVSAYDVSSDEGVQARVLRLTNNSRMFTEMGYPDDWPAVDGSGRALPGDELRATLGLAGQTRDGLDSRILAPGDTLTLYLPGEAADLAGTVIADQSVAAWTLSGIDFASSTYTRMVSDVDEELGDQVRDFRDELLTVLTATPTAEDDSVETEENLEEDIQEDIEEDVEGEGEGLDLAGLEECLAPVAQTILMNPEVARTLTERTASCTPDLLSPALAAAIDTGEGPAQMAEGVASNVLDGMPEAFEDVTEPWAGVSDALTDADAGFQVWLGPPPVQDYDYVDEPIVLHPGDDVDMDEWDPAFNTYVADRLDQLVEDNDTEPAESTGGVVAGTSCPEGEISIRRYRTDGFALAGLVTCGGESHTMVLALEPDGWQQIDDIQQDEYFGCEVMGSYSVPAFIAGDTCLDGEQTQEYTG